MAILKKGAKGADVRKLQEALNKNGAKLKVDGDFGKNTETAVKAFQKKAKLKADGQVGPLTEAALKFGGPLPVMDTPDYVKKKAEFDAARQFNSQMLGDFVVISGAIDMLNRAFLKEMEGASAVVSANGKHWDALAKLTDEIVKLQKEFEAKRLSDPKAAEKIAAQCAAKHKSVDSIGNAKISPNITKLGKHFDAAQARLAKDTATIDKIIDGARKRAAKS
ncbi:MAG: peptidoglycan-binding domain-containing protein [Pseudooceanicola sp.]